MPHLRGLAGAIGLASTIVPRALLIVSVAVALSLLGDQMLYAVLPIVHDAVGVPVTAIGLLLSANRLVRLVTNSLAGYAVERFGRHVPFVLALLLGGLTTIAYGVLHGVWLFLIARLLWGTAWSFIRLEGLSTVLDVAADETRGRYMGLFQAISRLGSAVALLVGGILSDLIGFRTTFTLFGGLTCLAAVLAHREMHQRRGDGSIRAVFPTDTAPASARRPPAAARRDQRLTQTPRAMQWRMIVASFGTFSTFLVIGGLASATLGYMLRVRFGSTPNIGSLSIGIASLTGFLLSTRGFLDLGFAPLVGHLSDRCGRHQTIFCALPVALMMMAALALLPPLSVVMGIIVVLFVAGTALNVAFNAVAGDIVPPQQRIVFLSLFVTCQDLGAAVGPLLGYWIGPAFGLVWLYVCGMVILLVASVFYGLTFWGAQPPVPAYRAETAEG